MSTTFPWFRFYSETMSDLKLDRISRNTGEHKMMVVGVWAVLLSLANSSPERGQLLISDDLPVTIEDLSAVTRMDEQSLEELLHYFVSYGLLRDSGHCWSIANWDKRQFDGDRPSTDRVRRHRKKAADSDSVTPANGEMFHETFHETPKSQKTQKRNVVDTDTDTESDPEGEAEAAEKSAPPRVAAAAAFLKQFGIAYNQKTAAIAEMDADYIRGHMAEVQKGRASPGLAITRMTDGDPVPVDPKERDLTRQIPPEYLGIIQH